MKRFLLLPVAFLIVFVTAASPAPQKHRIANIRNKQIPDGCGCYFQFVGPKHGGSEDYMFFASVEEEAEKVGWVNIDGRDMKLSLVSKTDPKGNERVGSRSTRKYVGPGIVLEATYVATRVCRRNDENCESTDYAATFKIAVQGEVQVIKASGGCGC